MMGMTTAHSHLPVMRSPQHTRSLRDVHERLSREDPDDVSRDVRARLFYVRPIPLERPLADRSGRTAGGGSTALQVSGRLRRGKPASFHKTDVEFCTQPRTNRPKAAKLQVEGPFRRCV